MSDVTPRPELVQPAWASAPPPLAGLAATLTGPQDLTGSQAPARSRDRPRVNALAIAALILAVLLSPLAALFGHIAAVQVARSRGRERGAAIAWVAVGLGYLWLAAAIVAAVAVWQLLGL